MNDILIFPSLTTWPKLLVIPKFMALVPPGLLFAKLVYIPVPFLIRVP